MEVSFTTLGNANIQRKEKGRMNIICFGDSNTYGYDPRGYFGGGPGRVGTQPAAH